MNQDEEKLQKAKFFFELALKSDDVIQKANERVNEKIRNFISLAATLVPIVLGVAYYILKQTTANYLLLITFFLSLASFVSAIVIGVFLQRPTGFRFFNPQKMLNKYEKKSLLYVISKSASTWSDIVVRNKKVVNSKQFYLNCMLGLICFGLFVLALAFLVLGTTI
jgi:cytochrome bd-type quinol oxidase subunit 1